MKKNESKEKSPWNSEEGTSDKEIASEEERKGEDWEKVIEAALKE